MRIEDERDVARLLRRLPGAPPGWVRAAKELPEARAAVDELVARVTVDGLVARARDDAEARGRLVADLDAALEAHGIDPGPAVVKALRALLGDE